MNLKAMSAPTSPEHSPFQNTDYTATNQLSQPSLSSVKQLHQQTELASITQRALAKIIDLLLWLPATAYSLFFLQCRPV